MAVTDDSADYPTDPRLAALKQVFNNHEEYVVPLDDDPDGDYKLRTTSCITPADRTALDALGFRREHTHAHTTDVDGETDAEIVLYLSDARGDD